jgi:hypothetical protein
LKTYQNLLIENEINGEALVNNESNKGIEEINFD